MPGFLTYFVSGIALYKYFDYYSKYKSKLIILALLDFLIEYHFNLEILLPISMAILIVSFAFGVKYLNDFGRKGDISYGIYIYHFPFIQLLVSLNLFELMNPFFMLISIPVCVILFAIFSWNFIEKRFIYRYKSK
jgi:peptidoglycan/LPS O-acetylase OafA/YrhL